MVKWVTVIYLLLIYSGSLMSQGLEETPYMNVLIENDAFNIPGRATDRYYTNGMSIGYSYEKENTKFPSSLLLKISGDKNVFNWGLAQYMFTPSRLDIEAVQYNDRPYAGALIVNHSLDSYDYSRRIKLTSGLYLGVMGPLSLADKVQIGAHRLFDNPKPQGWKNQVPNDIVINYNLRLEKELVYVPRKLLITGIIEARGGTLYDAMGVGVSLRAGRFNNFLEVRQGSNTRKNKSQLYMILKPSVRVIYYNALLQGGVITNLKKSHKGYIMDKDQIERINVFTEAGIIYTRPKINIILIQKLRTASFKSGNAIEIGRISIAFKI